MQTCVAQSVSGAVGGFIFIAQLSAVAAPQLIIALPLYREALTLFL
jgi:hypothetical protein